MIESSCFCSFSFAFLFTLCLFCVCFILWMWRSEENHLCWPLPSTLFETGSLWLFTAACARLAGLQGLRGFSCLHLPFCCRSSGITDVLCLLLCGFWEPELGSSWFRGRCFIHWVIFPALLSVSFYWLFFKICSHCVSSFSLFILYEYEWFCLNVCMWNICVSGTQGV